LIAPYSLAVVRYRQRADVGALKTLRERAAVFPTPVGVFLAWSWITGTTSCLPHARGVFPDAKKKAAGS